MPVHPLWRPFTPDANAARQGSRVGRRQTQPGPLEEHRPDWAGDFLEIRRAVAGAIGSRAIAVEHVGSTSVPDLVAKPIIDVDLTVADVDDEPAYLPDLEAAGFRLIFRDGMGGGSHRQLTYAVPNANLHVWGPDAIEPRRHVFFAAWLRSHDDDRRLYAAAKRAAVGATGNYNDRKSAVVYDVYERAFLADPEHPHDPHPRPGDDCASGVGGTVRT